MKSREPARRIPVSPLPGRLVTVAPALPGQGVNVSQLWHRGRPALVEHITLPPDGPLTGPKPDCKATVVKTRRTWRWHCACGAGTGLNGSWQRAYRLAYCHVRLNRLIGLVASMQEMADREYDCD